MFHPIPTGVTGITISWNVVCIFLLVQFHGSDAVDKFKLSSGHEIPAVGLGLYTMKLAEIEKAVKSALESGYRLFDTASEEDRDKEFGQVLKKWIQKGGNREEIFITARLPPAGNHPDDVETYLKKTLKHLGLDYVDLYLIHAPIEIEKSSKSDKHVIVENVDDGAVWKRMEQQVKAGRAKSIGLSNFNQSQILKVYNGAKIKPSSLQVELHAYYQQKSLQKFCKEHKIIITAEMPLGSPKIRSTVCKGTDEEEDELNDPVVKGIAKKYKKTEAQILLRHSVQAGIVVIPKSSNKQRQKQNLDIFDFTLAAEDVAKIDALDKGKKGQLYDITDLNKKDNPLIDLLEMTD